MSTSWQRARSPDEVPTPIAVALSDFCRRAGAPSGATEIRDALSALAAEDDFRIRALAEGEPEASPLGPFAAIDVVLGTSASLAARRQECGYYELARTLLQGSAAPGAEVSGSEVAAVAASAHLAAGVAIPEAPAPTTARARKAAAAAETVELRIAPRKRLATPALPQPAEEDEASLLARRELPKPRGRFANLPPARTSLQELQGEEGRPAMEELLGQHPHRFSLLRAMANQYSGPKGAELRGPEIDLLLEEQGLAEAFMEKERSNVLSAFSEHRGANGRVGWALELSPFELETLIRSLGLEAQVEELRERFREAALSPRTLAARLDLLGREKYLNDLGIAKRFRRTLEKDLREALDRARTEAPEADPVDQVSRWHAAPIELLQRAMERLGLTVDPREGASRTVPSSP